MKRLIISALLTLGVVGTALASASSPLSPAYKALYCYPTGTYWATQISHYADYYAAHDAFYRAQYGSGTRYC